MRRDPHSRAMLAQSDDGKVEAGVLSYAAHNKADISQNNA